jgi:hypothetical protein
MCIHHLQSDPLTTFSHFHPHPSTIRAQKAEIRSLCGAKILIDPSLPERN